LAASPLVDEPEAGALIRIVLHGLQGPVTVAGNNYNGVMPPQGSILNDVEIASALSYVRSTWGHQAPPVSAEEVATVRASVPRTTLWTWNELFHPAPRQTIP
jgi:mono/diheme cytochrome c family protein